MAVIIVVVVVSFGGLLLLGAFILAMCSFLNKRRRRKAAAAMVVHETEDADVEGRVRVHEVMIPGPHGTKIDALDVEADVNVHERIRKDEVMVEGGPHSHIVDNVASEVARRAAIQAAAPSTSKNSPVDNYNRHV